MKGRESCDPQRRGVHVDVRTLAGCQIGRYGIEQASAYLI